MYNLFYLAKPTTGGWATFTNHLQRKHTLNLFKISKRSEIRLRQSNIGNYRNLSPEDIQLFNNKIITAIDKNFYEYLSFFDNDTFLVIHDPTELKLELVSQLNKFKIITIRQSVKNYLKEKFNIDSKFILHPYCSENLANCVDFNNIYKKGAISISRIDYDKHIDVALKANQLINNDNNKIIIYGKANHACVYRQDLHKLNFGHYYFGPFVKNVNNLLLNKKYVVDMSSIKCDGGGTQYTFLEAIDNNCALIINKKWINGFDTPFINCINCFIIQDYNELANLLNKDPNVEDIVKNAKIILQKHLDVDWIYELNG